jgi:hypothetical protein
LPNIRDWIPTAGFYFDRPLVLFQSDDWGRVGLRDREGLELLRASGIVLGEQPYDSYTLETGDDLRALHDTLNQHRDSAGNHPCMAMNFVLFNVDFERSLAAGFRDIHLVPLAEGLPKPWKRPGLLDAYRSGIAEGVFQPALHGTTHFCRTAVRRAALEDRQRASLLKTLWEAGTPYVYWRMPWIGYEYWDPEQEENRFLTADRQRAFIGEAVGAFAKLFSNLPQSACAPGYRSNQDTHRAWADHGIRVAQNGPGTRFPPHFDRFGILHLTRTVEFEPATDPAFSIETCIRQAERCFELGLPAIVSVHSINFHSTVCDFRSPTIRALDQFLVALESRYPQLLYFRDEDLLKVIQHGFHDRPDYRPELKVTRKTFVKALSVRKNKS